MPKPKPKRKKKNTALPGYDKHREAMVAQSREKSEYRRDIGKTGDGYQENGLPNVANPDRKASCRDSLKLFCKTYFPNRFKLDFAECHLRAIDEMEKCTREGMPVAVAMPRGSGKTVLAEVDVIHSTLYGLQKYVIILQATRDLAHESFAQIKEEFETNELLLEDFPEVCYPIRCLERQHARSRGQMLLGKPTLMQWKSDSMVLPTVDGSPASGTRIGILGIESAGRGLKIRLKDGTIIRPGLIIADDCQTRESAKSPTQTTDRERIISDDIMGMVGPGQTLALIKLCTVIYPNDLSERFLDPEKHPEFRQIRTKMIEEFPVNMNLWERYADLRRDGFKGGDRYATQANEFYAENREEMDRGARVSWPERKKKRELSGIQSAMNLSIDNPRGFKAEYQNEPEIPGANAFSKSLIASQVASRLNGLPRCEVPREATRLTAFFDVGAHLHWYSVVAWNPTFGGSIIDYGCWPPQNRPFFAKNDPRPSLREFYPQFSESAAVYAGLNDVVNGVLGKTYYREATREELRIERTLIDAGYDTGTIYQFCRESRHAGIILPSKGVGRNVQFPGGISRWKTKPGELRGYHWITGLTETGRGRVCKFDPDLWKTFLHERLTTPAGSPGYLSLFGRSAADHEMISEHCAAEQSEYITVKGESWDKWEPLPHNPDNDLFDVLVGNCVAASVLGLTWNAAAAAGSPEQPKKVRKTMNQLYSEARARQGRT